MSCEEAVQTVCDPTATFTAGLPVRGSGLAKASIEQFAAKCGKIYQYSLVSNLEVIMKLERLPKSMFALLVVISLAACAAPASKSATTFEDQEIGQVVPVEGGGQYIDLSAQELKGMLDAKDFTFVNVHIPYEGEIPETDAFIPFDQIELNLNQFPQDTNAKIVLYCRSGSMSAIAARALVGAGYTSVFNLDGGFRAWAASGFEMEQ